MAVRPMLAPPAIVGSLVGTVWMIVVIVSLAPAASAAEATLEARSRAEVEELHVFIEEWSNGLLPNTDEAFARFDGVIATSFVIIDPDASTSDRETIVGVLRRAHGRWADAPGRIRIENFRLLQHSGDFALATYEEWHEVGGETSGRLSSVLFGPSDRGPSGLEWLHLHEVWLDQLPPTNRSTQ